MYLKSIEVHGFKSFANKILFEFHNGITGIVGPNGSGKSNVADAVRWVLGEQRAKQLRGGSMQDVIFSGTETRKPLSYASVAITLDNSDRQLAIDYEEVTVTRRLYRSGESEYLINGSVCRLKDVNELFYDTGIGKEGYSIIGQGQIDKILSGKPEERRELFDEAAGIVKFKRRKNMSLKKLEEERQNLLRINDILAELEKQVGPLKKQAETARLYLKKKEELKEFDINMFLLETARIKEQLADVERNLTLVNHNLEEAKQSYEDTKTEYEAIEEQTDIVDEQIEHAKHQLNETNLLKQQLQNQIELLKEQINSARMSDEHYASRALAIQEQIREREERRTAFEQEKEELNRQLLDVTAKEEEEKRKLNAVQNTITEVSALIEKKQNEKMQLLDSRASTKASQQKFHTMLEQIQVRRAEMNKKLIQAASDLAVHEESIGRYETELLKVSEEISEMAANIQSHEETIQELQNRLSTYNEQLRIGQTAYHRESSRLESLKNITERYDGYGNSIRRVMECKEREKGLLGVVADLIKVDKAYETAIETALGGNIQNIVTDNEDTAKRMIQYLKQNKYGRATFLPLTGISGGQGIRQQEALKEKGVIGTANTLVTVDETYRILADNLLGRTLVVDHIDNGIQIARKYRQSIRIVTTEGELINPGGSMTGGAFKNAGNLLSRRREIEEFEKTVLRLKQEMQKMEQEVVQKKEERAKHYAVVDDLNQKLSKLYVLQNTAKMNLNQALARKEDSVKASASMKQEGIDLETEMLQMKENQESIQVELETSEKLEAQLTTEIEESQIRLERERTIENEQQKQTESLHLSLAGLWQKQDFAAENLERVAEEISKLHEELGALEESKGNASAEIQNKEKQIEELRATIEESKELFAEIEEDIRRCTKEKEELTQKNKAFIVKREELSKHMSELDKEVFRLESRRETYEEQSEKQMNYMWEEYEITYGHAQELRNENMTNLAVMKKRIQELKGEIRGLGSVNVNAIEDYKNVSERYEFLKVQHDDLVEAEATLVQIIEELDAAMRKQFAEQFEKISTEFDKVFKILFGGGKGTLELLDDEDILEAGIKIIAQPPGKKLQNMMQLSGGEKALTAISLLFAIQNLKPSPFCLLDEIEAALDDSNVTRFAQYLHKLTKNTQFIVITHRRGTMTAADRLYGITMQEKGISTLVSVDLLENDLTK